MDEGLDLTVLSMQEGIVIDGERINGLGIPSGEDLRSNWGMESGCVILPIRFRGVGKFRASKFEAIDDPVCAVLLLFVGYGIPVMDGGSPLHSPAKFFWCWSPI